jgi:hypothetical protein
MNPNNKLDKTNEEDYNEHMETPTEKEFEDLPNEWDEIED